MKEFKVLKVLDKISGLYKKFGVDYEVLRLISNISIMPKKSPINAYKIKAL